MPRAMCASCYAGKTGVEEKTQPVERHGGPKLPTPRSTHRREVAIMPWAKVVDRQPAAFFLNYTTAVKRRWLRKKLGKKSPGAPLTRAHTHTLLEHT